MSDTNDCEVKVKIEPIDDEPVEMQLPQNHSKTWIKVRDVSLTYDDKRILEKGEKLSDKHINIVQRILRKKFPKINGLRLILLQDKPHKEPTNNALQIFHIGEDHWVCATTIGVSGKRVLVYDSGYTKWDESALYLLKTQFRCFPSNICIDSKRCTETAGREGMRLICVLDSILKQ